MLAAFSITVNGLPNQAPTISGTPPTDITVGNLYSFTPTASDADNDPLSFAVSGKPAWLNFDPATGTLSGTPVESNEGVYPGIQISVSDGADSAALAAFSITVNGLANQPPVIGGIPTVEVIIDGFYDFTPTASDPDNDPLSFAVSNKPAWLGFNANTGQLSGIPVAGDEGTYSGIGLSVSDGVDVSSLPDFQIAVVVQTLGSATLSWEAPTQNEDGTTLTDLAGFKVYYGPAVDNYPNVATINNPTVTTYLVENLSPGTWFFVVTAFNFSDDESEYSNPASKVVAP
jgi:hypothetical protein